jgi:Protein of unknown function (DUF1583) C domain
MNAVAMSLLLVSLTPGQNQPTTFEQDFRNSHIPLPALTLIGPAPETCTKPERGGFRVTLKGDGGISRPVGLRTKFSLSGDFEIVADYELLMPDTLTVGAGVSLIILTDSLPPHRAAISRLKDAKDGNVYLARSSTEQVVGERAAMPSTARAGKLRLARNGKLLHYSFRDAKEKLFRDVLQEEFGADKIAAVQFVARPGVDSGKVDARLVQWRIESGALPNLPIMLPTRAGGNAAIWVISILTSIALLLLGFCVWKFYLRSPAR